MFIKHRTCSSTAGFTLAEALIAFGLSSIVVTGILASFLGCGRSLLSLSNYTALNQSSQTAVDQLTREIRSVSCLTNFTTAVITNSSQPWFTTITNSVTFVPAGGSLTNSNNWVTFKYTPATRTLARTQSGTNRVLLTNCSFLNFQMFKRNQTNGTFIPIPTSSPAQTKIVQVNWICASINPMMPSQTESVESAKVVIRSK